MNFVRSFRMKVGLSSKPASSRIVGVIFSSFLVAGCVSAAKPVDVRGVRFSAPAIEAEDQAQAPEPGVAVIRFVDSSVDSSAAQENRGAPECRIRLNPVGGFGRAVEIPFSVGGWTFVLPPGRYLLSASGCPDMPAVIEFPKVSFEIRTRQLGYVGSFGPDDAVADEIRWLQNYRMQVPESTRDAFVSVWSGVLLTGELLDQSMNGRDEARAQLTSGRGFDPSPLLQSVGACRREEQAINPVRLGRVHLTVHYSDATVDPFVHEIRTAHTYTRSFIQCLQKSLKDYRPESGAPDVLSLEL
jgi:hypothetical protein